MLSFWNSSAQQNLDEYRQPTRVVAFLSSETDCPTCGWDPVNQSGKDMQCPTCNGVGKIISWGHYAIQARLSWDVLKFSYYAPASGAELGDCVISVSSEWSDIIDRVMSNERSYIHADDKVVRPKTKHENRVGDILSEINYVCNLFTPSAI